MPWSKRLNLLVVDDDAVDRMAVRRALATAEVEADVTEAENATGALAAMRGAEFDCVLLDFRLPGMDGLTLLRELRADGVNVPVVMLTGQGDEQTAVEIMRAGASDYIAKSALSAARLAESLHRVLRVRRAEIEAERARRALEESERQYRFLAEAIPQIVWTSGPDGAVQYFNQRASAYTGLPPEVLLGRGWEAIVHPDDREAMLAAWAESVRSGAPYEAELRLRAADGSHRWHLARAVAQRDAGGGVLRWFGTSTDIDEQKQFATLLARERALVEEANRAKDVFLATVSHELRTPLTAMLGWLRMLRTGALPQSKWERALETVERNARTQAQLVEDLLDASRIVAGKLRLEMGSVDLADVVESTVEVLRPNADARGVSLEARVERSGRPIRGDAVRLGQVISNLVANAIKFTPAGGQVTVALRVGAERVEVSVADTGQGITPELLPHVFEPFRQAQGAERRAQGGLGLGLAIVRHIVERHGGTVEARSEGTGRGACFVVTLPAAESPASWQLPTQPAGADSDRDAPPPARTTTTPPPGANALAGVRVLACAPADVLEVLGGILERSGAVVELARTPGETVELIAARRFDVALAAFPSPGADLIRRLRAATQEGLPRPPAVAIVSSASAEDRLRALAAGYNTHVTQPLDATELLVVLANVTGRLAVA